MNITTENEITRASVNDNELKKELPNDAADRLRPLDKIHMERRHIPHDIRHKKRSMFNVEFDEEDTDLMTEIFGDEDTAAAVEDIITSAPPEIQVLAVQLIELIRGLKAFNA